MIGGLVPIAGGLLASSGFIIARKPNAKDLLAKLAPYQGWIGAVMFSWGVWETISVVTHLGQLSAAPLRFVFWALVAATDLLVGFLLGYGLVTTYLLGKNEAAKEKAAVVQGKLVKFQVPLGFAAIVMGALYLIWSYVL
ncbi:MAG: hypothetical protein IPJ34_24630 [Myxococcales bacterium]|nr:hypothetical protein [Myxococcales bacterium]